MKLKFDIPTIEFDFTEEQLKRFVEYYETLVPDLPVIIGDKFNDEFLEIFTINQGIEIRTQIEEIANRKSN